jgi:transposase-like protein
MENIEVNNGRVTRDNEERAEIMDLYRESGLSKAQFARDYGIRYKTFCSWFKSEKLLSDEAQDEAGAIFYEVECNEARFTSPASEAEKDRLEIYYPNGVVVKVPHSFGVEKVSALVKQI